MAEIANEHGFRCEKYQVVTKDGYILDLTRVPGKFNETGKEKKEPLLLVHGLQGDMMEWVYNEANKAPMFILANAGYDVWMGNNRGNRFSDTHASLSNKERKYWQFTFEEMGT
jgi:lysosomal acid lipase/cholesteryl ester hydrolase